MAARKKKPPANSTIFVDSRVSTNFGVSNGNLRLDFLLPTSAYKMCHLALGHGWISGFFFLLLLAVVVVLLVVLLLERGRKKERKRERERVNAREGGEKREERREKKERERDRGKKRKEDKSAGSRFCYC